MRRHKSSSPSVSSCSSETEGKEVREKPRAELALELDSPGPVTRATLLGGGAPLSLDRVWLSTSVALSLLKSSFTVRVSYPADSMIVFTLRSHTERSSAWSNLRAFSCSVYSRALADLFALTLFTID